MRASIGAASPDASWKLLIKRRPEMRYGRRGPDDRASSPPKADHDNSAGGVVPHPFTGRLIDGGEAARWLSAGIAAFSGTISLCSAYLRAQALDALLAARGPDLRGRVLVRWQLTDLMAGASDLRAYEVAKAAGLQMWVRLDFHGKVFCVPDRGIVVGSANATLSGLGLRSQSNEEVCTLVPPSPENLAHIDRLFAGALLVDDQVFAEISIAVEAATQLEGSVGSMEWPEALLTKFQVSMPVEHLLASECLWSYPQLRSDGLVDLTDPHDLQLLGLSQAPVTSDLAVYKLRQTKVFRWLWQLLECSGEEGEYFGSLTAALHNSLLNDPVPQRQEVKALLQTLLSWCALLPAAGVIVDRPQHSQRVRLYERAGAATSGNISISPPESVHSGHSGRHERRSNRRSDRSSE